MFNYVKNEEWSDLYSNLTIRNIGYTTLSEQEIIRTTPITVFGAGGLGGTVAEQLIRTGCEQIRICDFDKFDETNLNRQICTTENIGAFKVDILEELLKDINPNVEVKKFYEINEENVAQIVEGSKVVVLALDGPLGSVLIARECIKQNIPMLESWVIPYLWAWWFTRDTISYEKCYELNTEDIPSDQLKNSEIASKKSSDILYPKLINLPGAKQFYDRESGAYQATLTGEIGIRSVAPLVRLTASYLAFEAIFTGVLGVQEMIFAPEIVGFDVYRKRAVKFNL